MSGDVAVLRLYNRAELMQLTTKLLALLIQNMMCPPTPNYEGKIYFKVPQDWGI